MLHSSPSMLGVVNLCKIARLDSRRSEMIKKSNITFNVSFIKYLKFCTDKKLIERVGTSRTGLRGQRKRPIYRTTDAGHEFLTLLGENN